MSTLIYYEYFWTETDRHKFYYAIHAVGISDNAVQV